MKVYAITDAKGEIKQTFDSQTAAELFLLALNAFSEDQYKIKPMRVQ